MKHISIILILFLFALHQPLIGQSLDFKELSCNSMINPLGIETANPLLSWQLTADGYNREQSAYHVLVASSPEKLSAEKADLWDSKLIHSSQSVNINYRGAPLQAKKRYYWKVMIVDEKGQSSDWSPVQHFEMALMEQRNWGESQWISLREDSRTSEHRYRDYQTSQMQQPTKVTSQAAGYFRKLIDTPTDVQSARAYICGLGYYELYINGQKTGDHVLDPAPSNYDKEAYYVAYDVTDQLQAGKNALGIILGNGFYGQNISWKNDPESDRDLSYGMPAVKLLLELTYEDGTEEVFFTDSSWKESTGPIVFDNIYGGDTYDARYEINGWNESAYDDSQWNKVKVVSPEVRNISAQQIPPIRKLQELSAKRVFKSASGKWIVDFGQNIAGWVKLQVQEKEGALIQIITTEALTQDGKDIFPGATGGGANGMKQLYEYVCKGSGMETWEPKFSYHGFRYAEITGISSKPDVETLKAVLVATAIDDKGHFSSNDPLLNKMNTVSKWTIVDNIHGIPEDCPHREKCGWLGDSHAFCEYALYNYEMNNFYKKYMEDIRTQMRPAPGINQPERIFQVPTMIAPGKRTSSLAKLDWGVATMYLPWYNYLYYGDTAIVREFYPEMKGLTEYYLTFKDDQGIIQDGMGDWCPPRWDRRLNPEAMECDPVISANAYFYDILQAMETMARINEDHSYAQSLAQEKDALFDAFNKTYLIDIPATEYKWYGSQTATVMALQFGMVPEDQFDAVLEGLVYDIKVVKGGHHSTGIHGNRYIYTVLSKYGKENLAYEILTTPTFPSQAFVLNYGFTTWPERQFEWDKVENLTNSLNHPMHSGFAAYFFESLGGIKTTQEKPGFKEFTVQPIFPDQITQTEVLVPTRYGNIQNSWKLEGSDFSMQLTVPFNTKARVILTDVQWAALMVNGEKFPKATRKELPGGSALILGSGVYTLSYPHIR